MASGGIDGPVVVSNQEEKHQMIRTKQHHNHQSIKPQPEILKAFQNDPKDLWRQIRDSQKLQQSETIKIPFNGEFIRSTFRYFYRSSYQSKYYQPICHGTMQEDLPVPRCDLLRSQLASIIFQSFA